MDAVCLATGEIRNTVSYGAVISSYASRTIPLEPELAASFIGAADMNKVSNFQGRGYDVRSLVMCSNGTFYS